MPRIKLKTVVLFYLGLLAAAWVWTWLRGDLNPFVHPDWQSANHLPILKGLGLGAATAIAVVVLSQLASVYFEWARRMELEFIRLLGPLRTLDILVLAVLSGVCEEALFRGAMQPTLGLALTTLIFGLMHIGPSLAFMPWTLSALVLGGVIGYYFEITGTLAGPIVCHILINLINLSFMQRLRRRLEKG